jgi:hypothetical protein
VISVLCPQEATMKAAGRTYYSSVAPWSCLASPSMLAQEQRMKPAVGDRLVVLDGSIGCPGRAPPILTTAHENFKMAVKCNWRVCESVQDLRRQEM